MRVWQEQVRRTRRDASGFTLIELMVVMAIISVLLAIALPIYQKSIIRAKESVLRNNLFTLDKQQAPHILQDLLTEDYLPPIPVDPMTGSEQTWRVIMEDNPVNGDNSAPGIWDVKSGSDKVGMDGTPYSDW